MFLRKFGFNSGDWGEQRQQVVDEMRSRFTDPSLSQGEKAKFGKSQISRVRTAYDEAHIQDTTEERVVYDRRKINEVGPPGGKASTGASCVLSRIGKGDFIQCMDLNKGYCLAGELFAGGVGLERDQGRHGGWRSDRCCLGGVLHGRPIV